MREEFHGTAWGQAPFKLLYDDWETLNANIWLPSLSELVGIDPNNYLSYAGVYWSAMQGLNTSTNPYTDAQGGDQFAYFAQYNAFGGGEKLWNACRQEETWLRSVRWDNATHAWMMRDATYFHTPVATLSLAVHPAAGTIGNLYAICLVQSIPEFFSIL